MKLFNYYGKAVIYPSVFILIFSAINSIFANYENDGQSDTSAIVISIVTSLIFCLLMSVLSLTIFLNRIKRLNKSLIWNLLSWFLLPSFYLSIIFIHDIKIRIKYDFGFGNDFLYLVIMTIPFVIALGLTFNKYRQKITTVDIA